MPTQRLENDMNRLKKSVLDQPGLLSASLIVCLSICLGQATTLEPMNLQEIVERSGRIFTGECLSASQGVDARGLPYSLYTFRVLESVKGRFESGTFTLKQFGIRSLSSRSASDGKLTRIDGMPDYQPGATYTLFLSKESRWGFSSPVGLVQGAFRVLGEESNRRVINGIGNRNLLLNPSETATQRLARRQQALRSRAARSEDALQGPVDYSAFLSAVQRMAQGETINLAELGRSLTAQGGAR